MRYVGRRLGLEGCVCGGERDGREDVLGGEWWIQGRRDVGRDDEGGCKRDVRDGRVDAEQVC